MISEETRTYDRYGRLAEIRSDGKSVRYSYDKAGRVARQDVDGRTIAFSYTKYGRLADKTLSGALGVLSNVRYWYGKDGKIVARLANGISQKYFYDAKGQLLKVVALDGTVCERYAYDPILDEECSATVSVKSQLATSKQITTHYIGGIEVEIWANVYLEMVVMSENGERMSINSIEYKDKHFACFIEKEE